MAGELSAGLAGDVGATVGDALRRHWRVCLTMLLVGVVAMSAVLIVMRLGPPTYQSEASVLLTGSRYQVKGIDTSGKLTTNDNLSDFTQAANAQRAEEYRTVALAPQTRRLATEYLRNRGLAPEVVSDAKFDVRVRGPLITAIGTAGSPADAKATADAFAAAIAARLDEVYGQTERDREQFEREALRARGDADALDAQLTALKRDDRIDDLQRQIAQKDGLRAGFDERRKSSLTSRLASFDAALQQVDRLYQDAEALRAEVRDAGRTSISTAAQAITLMDLQLRFVGLGAPNALGGEAAPAAARVETDKDAKTQVITLPASGGTAPAGIAGQTRLDIAELLASGTTRTELLADVESLLQGIDARKRELEQGYLTELERLSEQVSRRSPYLLYPRNDRIEELSQQVVADLTREVQDLQAAVREETTRREALTKNLQNARTTQAALEGKLDEARLLAAAGSGKAVVVAEATIPSTPISPQPLSRALPTALMSSLIVGLLLSVVSVVVLEIRERGRTPSAAQAEPLGAGTD